MKANFVKATSNNQEILLNCSKNALCNLNCIFRLNKTSCDYKFTHEPSYWYGLFVRLVDQS